MNSTISLPEVDAKTLRDWLKRGQVTLIDLREREEYARERIPGGRLASLSHFDPGVFAAEGGRIAVFYCLSGQRTRVAALRLQGTAYMGKYALAGGLSAWKAAGLPVERQGLAPPPVMRQVQVGAGALALVGLLLAAAVSPWFLALVALVGCDLLLQGVTGHGVLSRSLVRAPWNRRPWRNIAPPCPPTPYWI
jgi:rhodanese-related sulfurtransferase